MVLFFPYNTESTLRFVLIGSATAAYSTAGSGSLSGTNILISKDGGALASSTNTGTAIGSGLYQVVLTTSELSAKQVVVIIARGTLGTTVENQAFYIMTYGSASAQYAFDLGKAEASANLVQILGTAAVGTSGTLTNVGTLGLVLTGTVTTVTNVVSANLVQILGTAAVGTSGTLTNVGTVGLVLTGTITTVTNVTSANVVQILGTAVVGTSGTLTNVGTVGLVLTGTVTTVTNITSANVVQILGTAAVGTSGTLTNVGTVGLVLTGTVTTISNVVSADMRQVDGNATAAANLRQSALGITTGSALSGTLTSSTFTVDLSETANDFYNDRLLVFISGGMARQAGSVTDYFGSASGTLARVVVSTLTTAPASGDRFIIV